MSTLVQMNSHSMSLLFPPNPAFAHNPPTGGILLNHARAPSPSPSHLNFPKNQKSSSSGQRSTSKIRFAPLPDPRKSSDDDDESLSSGDDDRSDQHGLSSSPATTAYGSEDRGREKSWKKKKYLKPFLSVSGSSSQSSPSKSPLELAGNSLSLFRSTSRESMNSEGDHTQQRRKSTGALSPSPAPSPLLPLRPTISADSPSLGGTKRMLNGRVYGRRPTPPSPQVDRTEPEFVEWGYGGMGSNRSGERFYNKVQGTKSTFSGEGDREDEEDGSGMSWVRRRREQREKEKAEKAKMEQVPTPTIAVHPPATPEPVEQHVTATIAVSVPHHHRSHSGHSTPRPSRSNSTTVMPSLEGRGRSGSALGLKDLHISTNVKPATNVQVDSSPERSASTNASVEGDDESDEEEDGEGEDDSEESEEDEKRMTSVCAGVEKVSRHRE